LSQSANILPYAKFTKVKGKEGTYDFSLWLDVPNEQKSRIKKVTYVFNHPTFNNKVFVSNNQANGFMVSYRGWGCLSNVTIKIEGQYGVSLISLDMCGALKER
jgi:transcription initiation factor IIF auxiliary subunit